MASQFRRIGFVLCHGQRRLVSGALSAPNALHDVFRTLAALLCLLAVQVSSAQTVVVDDADAGFVKHGAAQYWFTDNVGYAGRMTWTYTSDAAHGVTNWAEWLGNLPKRAIWRASVFIPRRHANSQRAKYKVDTRAGVAEVVVDQSPVYDAWVTLGEFDIDARAGRIVLEDQTGEGWGSKWLGFDAVRWEFVRDVRGNTPSVSFTDIRMIGPSTLEMCASVRSSSWTSLAAGATAEWPGHFQVQQSRQRLLRNGDLAFLFCEMDLPQNHRFRTNVTLRVTCTVRDNNGQVSIVNGIRILLPTILVPGINAVAWGPSGGDDNYPNFKNRIDHLSRQTGPLYSFTSGIRMASSGTGYPTLHDLVYNRAVGDNLQEAATKLGDLVDYALSRSHATRVNIIGHSRGGLVARAYVSRMAGDKVDWLITANTPHTGAALAGLGGALLYADLRPIYPWFRVQSAPLWSFLPPSNGALEELAAKSIPSTVRAAFLGSVDLLTIVSWNLVFRGRIPYPMPDLGEGDNVVPISSQLGEMWDSLHRSSVDMPGVFRNGNVMKINMGRGGHGSLDKEEGYAIKIWSLIGAQ